MRPNVIAHELSRIFERHCVGLAVVLVALEQRRAVCVRGRGGQLNESARNVGVRRNEVGPARVTCLIMVRVLFISVQFKGYVFPSCVCVCVFRRTQALSYPTMLLVVAASRSS